MTGKHFLKLSVKKVCFELRLDRNITIVAGDSATGKTTILDLLSMYRKFGSDSGIIVKSSVKCIPLTGDIDSDFIIIKSLKEAIILIDEDARYIFSKEFARIVESSGLYFVICSRKSLKCLPYSTRSIYRLTTIWDSEHYLTTNDEIYSNVPAESFVANTVVTEDSGSGYQMFSRIFKEAKVIYAGGNSNINDIALAANSNVLAIVDGAAFGAFIEDFVNQMRRTRNSVMVWCPESFEYLLIKSGVIYSSDFKHIEENMSDYIDSKQYVSWERYFTALAIESAKSHGKIYSKSQLPKWVGDKEVKMFIKVIPENIRPKIEED